MNNKCGGLSRNSEAKKNCSYRLRGAESYSGRVGSVEKVGAVRREGEKKVDRKKECGSSVV